MVCGVVWCVLNILGFVIHNSAQYWRMWNMVSNSSLLFSPPHHLSSERFLHLQLWYLKILSSAVEILPLMFHNGLTPFHINEWKKIKPFTIFMHEAMWLETLQACHRKWSQESQNVAAASLFWMNFEQVMFCFFFAIMFGSSRGKAGHWFFYWVIFVSLSGLTTIEHSEYKNCCS